MKQGCRVTPGGGNPRESATEKSLPWVSMVRVKRWGKSPPRTGQPGRHGKPHPEQCRIGASRGKVRRPGATPPETSARDASAQERPGWQLDPASNSGARGMVIQGGKPPGQNPAYRPSAQFSTTETKGALPPRAARSPPGYFSLNDGNSMPLSFRCKYPGGVPQGRGQSPLSLRPAYPSRRERNRISARFRWRAFPVPRWPRV